MVLWRRSEGSRSFGRWSWTAPMRGFWRSSTVDCWACGTGLGMSRQPPASRTTRVRTGWCCRTPTAAELDVQHQRALALGARLLHDRSDDPQEPLRVYADPAGHPFCIFVANPAAA